MIVKLNLTNIKPLGGGTYTTGPDGAIRDTIKTLMDHDFVDRSLKLQVGIDGSAETVEAVFEDPMKAAIFLATMSADQERATQFKLFWGGN